MNKSCPRNPNTEKSHVISEGYGALFFCGDFYFNKIKDLEGRFKSPLNHLLIAIVSEIDLRPYFGGKPTCSGPVTCHRF